MFYYYGGKAQAARRYPPPRFPVIVEPFAGAAGYAMHHIRQVDEVVLVERNPRVAALWRMLLDMTPAEVLAYPIPEAGTVTDDLLVMVAAASNASLGMTSFTVTERAADSCRGMLRRIARLVPDASRKVRILEGDYTDAPDIEATWLVDPPYQVPPDLAGGSARGDGYGPHGAAGIDFAKLGAWCQERQGQVIVCEASGADWLPFVPLYGMSDTIGKRRVEVLWTNEPATLF